MTENINNINPHNYGPHPTKKAKKTLYILLSSLLVVLVIFILIITLLYPQYIGQTVATKVNSFSPNTFNSPYENTQINTSNPQTNEQVAIQPDEETLEKLENKTNTLNNQITTLQNQLGSIVNELKNNKTDSQKIELVLTGSRLVAALQQGIPFNTYLERFVYLNNNSDLNNKLLEIQKYSASGILSKNQLLDNYNQLYKTLYLHSLKKLPGIRAKIKYYFYSLFFVMNTKKITTNTTLVSLNSIYYDIQSNNYTNALKTLQNYANNEDVIIFQDNINALVKADIVIKSINEELNNLVSNRSLHVK